MTTGQPAVSAAAVTGETSAASINRAFYDPLWQGTRFLPPERFNTWPVVTELAAQAPRRLELGPGLRPRLPLNGTRFVDLSPPAVTELNRRGGEAIAGSATALPFADDAFDLVCACDIVEHVADDTHVFAEIDRVLAPGGTLLLSAPLHPERWTDFDTICGHMRRYRPDELTARLAAIGLRAERGVAYGMQPQPWLINLGLWFTTWMPRRARFTYNWLIMPIALRLQPTLVWVEQPLTALANADEVMLVCRRI